MKANREKISLRVKAWQEKNRDKVKKYKKKWRESNKERTNFLKRRRIYLEKNAEGKLTMEDVKKAYSLTPICPYCNSKKSDTIDHMTPLSRGGSNDPSNLIAVCRSCNSKKHTKTLIEFAPILYVMWDRGNGYA